MNKKTGRKPKAEKDKIKQHAVYLTEKERKEVLTRHQKKDLTELVRHFNQ